MERVHMAGAAVGEDGALHRLRRNWPEYLIEGWALGCFMVSASMFATLLDSPASPAHHAIANAEVRRALVGLAMGLTAMALIYSPWGQRSGAHMNPAVTLTFLRLGKINAWDACFYVFAQFLGGTIGVVLAATVLGPAFTTPPVSYVTTMPGEHGLVVAFASEVLISFALMYAVLRVSNTPRIARFTGLVAGVLVATYITLEAPLSGMSMNPARSFASAAPAAQWHGFWIYVAAPILGMLGGAQLFLRGERGHFAGCAKLLHPNHQRCIHCGHEPGVP